MLALVVVALLSSSARAQSSEPTAEPDEHASSEVQRMTLQGGLTGALDPRVRLAGRPDATLTWQVSAQLYGRPGAGLHVFPSLGPHEGSFVAVRLGGLLQLPAGDDARVELGLALEPLSGVEAGLLGLQTDYSVVGAVVLAPLGWFHTAEWTGGLDMTLSGPVSLWLGGHVSAAAMWVDGRSLLDERDAELTAIEALELLQPTVALTVQL